MQVGATQESLAQVRPRKVGPGQVRSIQRRLSKVGSLKVRFLRVRSGRLGSVRPREVGPGQVRPSKFSLRVIHHVVGSDSSAT